MRLTTNHASSSYGIPVLVDDNGHAYGKFDELPSGRTAAEYVADGLRGIVPLTTDWDDPVDLAGSIEDAKQQASLFLR